MRYTQTLAALMALLLATSVRAETEVYSNLSADEDDLYNCCDGIIVAGQHISANFVAMPFTPATDVSVTEVDVALSRSVRHQSAQIAIAETNERGVPGYEMFVMKLTGMPLSGRCCRLVVADVPSVHLTAGHQYWIVLKGKDVFRGYWDFNTTGDSGDYAVNQTLHGWRITSGTRAAFRVVGD